MEPSPACIDLIRDSEGFRAKPYNKDGHPTIGYGNTYYADGRRVTMADPPIDEPTARALMLDRLANEYAPQVRKVVRVPLTQGQFDAVVDFAYNEGIGHLIGSTSVQIYVPTGTTVYVNGNSYVGNNSAITLASSNYRLLVFSHPATSIWSITY